MKDHRITNRRCVQCGATGKELRKQCPGLNTGLLPQNFKHALALFFLLFASQAWAGNIYNFGTSGIRVTNGNYLRITNDAGSTKRVRCVAVVTTSGTPADIGKVAVTDLSITTGADDDCRPASGVEWLIHQVLHEDDITLSHYDGSNAVPFATSDGAPTTVDVFQIDFTNQAAPSTPATGINSVYSDSTQKRLTDKNADGTVANTVVPKDCDNLTPGDVVKSISAAGVVGCTAVVAASLFNAHTILQATSDNTPVALTVGEQSVVGRATSGNITALAIDSDLSSVSGNDDTLPSAKATKAALDLKANATAVKPIYIDAGSISVDGTHCVAPTEQALNSAEKTWATSCADNNGGIMSGKIRMPTTWNASTVTFTLSLYHATTETITFAGDFSAQCRGAGDAINSTYGTAVAADVSITTAHQIAEATTSAVTPNGTCAAGDFLLWRYVVDATNFSANAANAKVLSVTINATY